LYAHFEEENSVKCKVFKQREDTFAVIATLFTVILCLVWNRLEDFYTIHPAHPVNYRKVDLKIQVRTAQVAIFC